MLAVVSCYLLDACFALAPYSNKCCRILWAIMDKPSCRTVWQNLAQILKSHGKMGYTFVVPHFAIPNVGHS